MTVAIRYSLDVQCLGPPVAHKLAYPLTHHRDFDNLRYGPQLVEHRMTALRRQNRPSGDRLVNQMRQAYGSLM